MWPGVPRHSRQDGLHKRQILRFFFFLPPLLQRTILRDLDRFGQGVPGLARGGAGLPGDISLLRERTAGTAPIRHAVLFYRVTTPPSRARSNGWFFFLLFFLFLLPRCVHWLRGRLESVLKHAGIPKIPAALLKSMLGRRRHATRSRKKIKIKKGLGLFLSLSKASDALTCAVCADRSLARPVRAVEGTRAPLRRAL